MKKHWKWLVGIILLELGVLYSIPPNILSAVPVLVPLVEGIAVVAPVVTNFNKIAAEPGVLSVYLAISVLLLVPKSIFMFMWLNSDLRGMYRHFVISPLTATTPESPADFVLDPIKTAETKDEKPRSLTSRILLSIVIVIVGLGILFAFLNYGFEINEKPLSAVRPKFFHFAAGGWPLWVKWSVIRMMVCGLMVGVIASIVRDYWIYLSNRVLAKGGSHE